MIRCPVCGEQNEDLAVVCRSCKSFVQAKVDTLDLFSTIWGLLESPSVTFKKILLSRNKNYVLLLSCTFGIALVYAFFWYKNLGRLFANVLLLLGAGLIAGPVVGVAVTSLISLLARFIAGWFGGRLTQRNMFSVAAYATVPVLFSLVFVLPVEVAIFGNYFFDDNPSPLVINPVLYLMLLAFDAVAVIWMGILMVLGSRVAFGFPWGKAFAVVGGTAIIFGLAVFGLRFV